jgi:hypothetical protein
MYMNELNEKKERFIEAQQEGMVAAYRLHEAEQLTSKLRKVTLTTEESWELISRTCHMVHRETGETCILSPFNREEMKIKTPQGDISYRRGSLVRVDFLTRTVTIDGLEGEFTLLMNALS